MDIRQLTTEQREELIEDLLALKDVVPIEESCPLKEEDFVQCGERMQKGIAHWDKQNYAVPAPNCVLKVREEIIKDKGL